MSNDIDIIIPILKEKMYRQKDNKMEEKKTIGQKIPNKPKVYTQEELEIRAELQKFKDSYIFVNTNFKRKSEPIFALAFCEVKRNIGLDKISLIYKTDEEIFHIISEIIKEHYIDSDGNIGIWGDIVNYVYHHSDGEAYVFDTEGTIIRDIDIFENRAILKLR
jgi:hypothetical protein